MKVVLNKCLVPLSSIFKEEEKLEIFLKGTSNTNGTVLSVISKDWTKTMYFVMCLNIKESAFYQNSVGEPICHKGGISWIIR